MEPDTLFKAMADPSRQKILKLLQERELSVSELVEVLAQPQSTVSRHLKKLHSAGLLRDRRQGTATLYSVPAESDGQQDGVADLSRRLLTWAAEQVLPRSIDARLEAVLDRRRERSERFFDRVGRYWDQLREESFGVSFHIEAFLNLLPRGWTVADIGAGTGYLVPVLARRFERLIAVEPVDRMLEVAHHRTASLGLDNVDLRKGGLSQLPIQDETVDLAVAMLVLHHVPSPPDALAELNRIIRPGGKALIVEQDAHDHDEFHERMQDHWWGFGREEFVGWLRSAGFAEIEMNELAQTDRSLDAPELFVVTGTRIS
jgi:ubiquinone/menaquinone biosynthesis C-methylase UbiE